MHEALFPSVSIHGTHLTETYRIFRSPCKMVSTDPTDMPALAAMFHSQVAVFHNHLFHSHNHVFRSDSARLWLLWFFFTRCSAFFELLYPRTHTIHVHNAIIACITQLLTNFDGFHATQVVESDNHTLFFEYKRRHFQYLKHYCHSTTSHAFNG